MEIAICRVSFFEVGSFKFSFARTNPKTDSYVYRLPSASFHHDAAPDRLAVKQRQTVVVPDPNRRCRRPYFRPNVRTLTLAPVTRPRGISSLLQSSKYRISPEASHVSSKSVSQSALAAIRWPQVLQIVGRNPCRTGKNVRNRYPQGHRH